MPTAQTIEKAYQVARERYAEYGVDPDAALAAIAGVPLSLHCWQGDDVGGFERPAAALSGGGIQVTGNYPGKARTVDELRLDLEKALSLLPGRHRVNLHASYGEFGGQPVDRDRIELAHYRGWMDWAKARGLGLDFNATLFSHPKADDGWTLSHPDPRIRSFWVEHVKRCRAVAAEMGRRQAGPCIHNLWIPDGSKDLPADRWTPRRLLRESLDAIYGDRYPVSEMKDAVESKLFGIASEAYVVGSHEFYFGYALLRGLIICLDLGHFHPTESVADKVSAVLQFSDELLLHLSRGLRWDSDHVVTLTDDVRAVMEEIVRGEALGRVHLALDFFDASINRVGAWVVGARAVLKALLAALLEPRQKLKEAEKSGDNFARLALMEEAKALPFGAVWDYHCLRDDVPVGPDWLGVVRDYEAAVTSKRT
jgi:L-rhamnose isomerase